MCTRLILAYASRDPERLSKDQIELREMAGWYAVELSRYYPVGAKRPVMNADAWLERATPNVYLIKQDGETAGFIVVAVRPAIPGVMGNYLAEFFVLPQYRKGKTAMLAGGELMRQMPGEWTADVLQLNEPSLRFSRAMTRRYGKCAHERTICVDSGIAVRFRWVSGG